MTTIVNEPTLTPAAADMHDRLVRARNGDPCYEGETRRAVSIETLEACNAGYTHMYRRALAAEERAAGLEAEVDRLRGVIRGAEMAFRGRVA